MQNRLYVGNLGKNPAATSLQELFEPHGLDGKLVPGDAAARPFGFAVVTLATDECAGAAMNALNSASVHGVVIKVKVAQSQACGVGTGSGGES